jgi:hypothetical protein
MHVHASSCPAPAPHPIKSSSGTLIQRFPTAPPIGLCTIRADEVVADSGGEVEGIR